MSGRWWRAYERSRNDPKLLKLSDKDFRGWYNIVCTASAYGGELPPIPDLAIEIRRSEDATAKLIKVLTAAQLLDENDGRYTPHNWSGLQYKSDVSNDRVKRHRQRKRNVTETPSENRDNSEPNGSDAGASPDVASVIFGQGRVWLEKSTGKTESACRSLLGKWRKTAGDEGLVAILGAAQRAAPIDAVEWIEKALQQRAPPKSTGWN